MQLSLSIPLWMAHILSDVAFPDLNPCSCLWDCPAPCHHSQPTMPSFLILSFGVILDFPPPPLLKLQIKFSMPPWLDFENSPQIWELPTNFVFTARSKEPPSCRYQPSRCSSLDSSCFLSLFKHESAHVSLLHKSTHVIQSSQNQNCSLVWQVLSSQVPVILLSPVSQVLSGTLCPSHSLYWLRTCTCCVLSIKSVLSLSKCLTSIKLFLSLLKIKFSVRPSSKTSEYLFFGKEIKNKLLIIVCKQKGYL